MKTVKVTPEFDRWEAALKDRAAIARIRVRIRRLSLGNPGQHRVLSGGVAELKVDFGPGYRIYYTERAGEIVILLCGGTKRSQTADIEEARRIAKKL